MAHSHFDLLMNNDLHVKIQLFCKVKKVIETAPEKMTTTFSAMIGDLFDIIIVAATEKKLYYWPIKA